MVARTACFTGRVNRDTLVTDEFGDAVAERVRDRDTQSEGGP
jgi:hypothetical protein